MRTSERAGGVSPVALRKPDKRGCKSPPLTLCGILMPSRGGARRPPSLKHLQSWKRRYEWIEMASLGGQNGCYYDCYTLQPLLYRKFSIPSVPSLLEEKTHTVAATIIEHVEDHRDSRLRQCARPASRHSSTAQPLNFFSLRDEMRRRSDRPNLIVWDKSKVEAKRFI